MLYVVYIELQREHAPRWETWMRDHHIDAVLATGFFERAWLVRDTAADSPTHVAFRSYYLARSEDALAAYQRDAAANLQADHRTHFDGLFTARRETLPIVARHEPRTGA